VIYLVIVSINPATLEKVGEIEECTSEEIEKSFQIARQTQKAWQRVPLKDRARRVGQINRYLLEHTDEISLVISNEVGKPVGEAFISEVFTAIDSTLHYYSNIEEYLSQEEIELGFYSSLNKRSYLIRRPAGVVAVIGPYNYPFIIPFEQIVQALMGGNAAIFKPSSETALVGKKIQ
jgi:acyl-CoA reductase-like NAD-dependent aldehyde dehydrogenase